MKRIAVLGSGLVGATIARDLAADGRFAVTAADVSPKRLAALEGVADLQTVTADLSSAERVGRFVQPFDVVVGALPSQFGFGALEAVIEARKPYCDISFMPEDALALDALAKERGVCAVVDCGVAPGLANLAVGRSHARFDRTERAVIYVGGLPRIRRWPFEYKAPFAPADVIQEYTRPARLRRGGRLVVKPALSEPELLELDSVGTLEAVLTDGLRSLLTTIEADELVEKTLRYPGHAELMRVLRETGFFNPAPVEVEGKSVSPLAVTSRLLFARWALAPGEPEFTALRVVVEGVCGTHRERHSYRLFDETDPKTGQSSMARTTGFPCAIVARLLASGALDEHGVKPPERLVPIPGLYEHVVSELDDRGVLLSVQVEPLG